MDHRFVVLIVFKFLIIESTAVLTNNCHKELTPKLSLHKVEKLLANNDSYIDVETGLDLTLKCVGHRPIIWHADFVDDLYSDKEKEYINITDVESSSKDLFISYLTVSEISFKEIGIYSCHYRNRFSLNSNKNNSIYVFVTDQENLFAYHEIFSHPTVNNSRAVICRPTSSLTTVSLYEWSPVFGAVKVKISPENGITFDSRHGFTIQKINKDRLRCLGLLNGKPQQLTKTFEFHAGLDYDPVINDLNREFIFIGNNFTLNCTVRLLHRDSLYSIEWNTDRICSKDLRDRLVESVANNFEYQGQYYLNRNLTITNAQLADAGYYECLIGDASSNKRNVTKYIEIFDSPKLELISEFQNPLSLNYKQDLIVNISINSIPNDSRALSMLWSKNGYSINQILNDRINIYRNGSDFSQLMISEVKCEDSGLYTFDANLLNITFKTISFNLTINGCNDYKTNEFRQSSDTDRNEVIVLIVIFVVFGITLLALAVMIGQKIRETRRQKRELAMLNFNIYPNGQIEINPDLPLDEQIDLLPYDERYEFPREHLIFGSILGQGAFGRVVLAEAYGIDNKSSTTSTFKPRTVAVKMLKEHADLSQRKALLTELKILIHVGKHLNIVNLLGAVTENLIKGELLVIVEYCKFGNIRSFLMNQRNNFINQLDENNELINSEVSETEPKYQNINEYIANDYQNCVSFAEINDTRVRKVKTSDLINYVFQCAKGMEYLSYKKLIHRDLAARNVLLADDDIVKICDFGLARDCYNYDNYVKKGDGPLPIKWMAIESMRDKIYTEKSDVWSFGVFMWEIFTLGSHPYPGFDLDQEFYNKLINGYRMDRPKFAPNIIYTLMQNCWSHEPNDRPDFRSLAVQLKDLTDIKTLEKYENHLQNYAISTENSPTDSFLNTTENKEEIAESYVDMTIKKGSEAQVVYHVNQNYEGHFNIQEYDRPKNVRSIFANTPVPIDPMEAVPMIQL